jgi:hypothetical protein
MKIMTAYPAHTYGKLALVFCIMTCMRVVLSPQVTVVVVKNSFSHKPSLIGYQRSGDKCNIINVLVKKHHPNGCIMLIQMLYPLQVIQTEIVVVRHS